jgi:RNA polymerase sigma-70 factor (ECF subfamily)
VNDATREEADLVGRARQGESCAFGELVRRYQRRVYGVARRIVRRHELADDVVQETFLRAYDRLDSFDTGRPFGPWICRIAANLAINELRSPRAREQPLPEGHEEEPSQEASPLAAVLGGEIGGIVAAAMEALPPEQRAVLVLRAVEELSYGEIATTLGIAEGTVMSRLHRARRRVAEALAPLLQPSRLPAGGAS